jgi:hypothetical protein
MTRRRSRGLWVAPRGRGERGHYKRTRFFQMRPVEAPPML